MRKMYSAPIVEKITFDYKIQTNSSYPQDCFGSVINVSTGSSICEEGTPSFIGWNFKHPGEF